MQMHEKIKYLRKQKKLSQQELSEILNVHKTHISRLETARYTPSLKLVKKLAGLFEVTTDYLLYDDIEKNENIDFSNRTLMERMKLIDNLNSKDQDIILGVMDAFLTKQQMWSVLNQK